MLTPQKRLEQLLRRQREHRDGFFTGGRPTSLESVWYELGRDAELSEAISATRDELRGLDDDPEDDPPSSVRR